MSYACLILGESGTGKTCSLRNLNPSECLLIQPTRKPLPFRSKGWREIQTKGDGGNIFVSCNVSKVLQVLQKAPQNIIVIDDFQYFLINAYMARRTEKSFEKFSEFAGMGYDLVRATTQLSNNKRVYVLGHSTTDEFGTVRVKTIGKMLDSVIVLEGLFTTVLRTRVDPATNSYLFLTKNDGHDTTKSPLGMFDTPEIENDLAEVDKTICAYYGIANQEEVLNEKG